MDATKLIRYDIWTYRRNPNNANNPGLIQTSCLEEIPLAVCGSSLSPDAVITLSQYFTRLVERHQAEALFSQLFPHIAEACAACGSPATQALHQLVPTLTAEVEPAVSGMPPMTAEVTDFMVPICSEGGPCEEQAYSLLKQKLLDGMVRARVGVAPVELQRHCQVCGVAGGLRRCQRCRLVSSVQP